MFLVLIVVADCFFGIPLYGRFVWQTFHPRVAVLQQIFREVKATLFPKDSSGHTKMRLPSSIAAAS